MAKIEFSESTSTSRLKKLSSQARNFSLIYLELRGRKTKPLSNRKNAKKYDTGNYQAMTKTQKPQRQRENQRNSRGPSSATCRNYEL